MDLSIVMPARNEAGGIGEVIHDLLIATSGRSCEIIVVDDHSSDPTAAVAAMAGVMVLASSGPPGIGHALRRGIAAAAGKWTCFVMSDWSDSPESVLRMYELAKSSDLDAVFGDRWSGAEVSGYPPLKRILNRIGNRVASELMACRYSDWTNIHKLYRTSLLREMATKSDGFEIGLEMSLKAVNRGARFAVVNTEWKQRRSGSSKMRLTKNAFRCFRILLKEIRNTPSISYERTSSAY